MSPSDHDALRTQLAVCFNRLTQGFEDACKVEHVVLSLKETFYASMRDLIRTWDTRNAISKLPAEVLAMCIGFLPLRDRIVATHVSHTWRAAALAVPSLWSDITISPDYRSCPEKVLGLVLSRTGTRPVDFAVDRATHDFVQHASLAEELMNHMHHIRSVVWPDAVCSIRFDLPAPMLESFHTRGDGLHEEFLGGSAGRLRTLHFGAFSPPEICPAVATVTDLECYLPEPDDTEESAPSHLSRLFTLFPQVRSLSLSSILPAQAAVLGEIRPLCPLSELSLGTEDLNCDVFALYEAWRTDILMDVRLGTQLASLTSANFASYFLGACDLTIKISVTLDVLTWARIEAAHTDGRKHSLDLVIGLELDAGAAKLGEFFAAAQAAFAQLRSLTIPTSVCAEISRLAVELPALKELKLAFEEYPEAQFALCGWPWKDLQPCVERLLARPVEALVVDMRRYFRNPPPVGEESDDVGRLLEQIRPIAPSSKRPVGPAHARLPGMQIRIRGISADVAIKMESEFRVLGIAYDAEDPEDPPL